MIVNGFLFKKSQKMDMTLCYACNKPLEEDGKVRVRQRPRRCKGLGEETHMADTDLTCPVVRDPESTGVATIHPDLAQLEGAHLLANHARPFLEECGFTDDQILHWALTYVASVGSGDVESFVTWIHTVERCAPESQPSTT